MIEWQTFPCQFSNQSAAGEPGELHQRERYEAIGLRRLLSILVIVLAVFRSVSVAAGADEGLPVFTANELGVSVTQWTVEDGLPTPHVTALAQMPDGFIYCGTSRGLVRFDGVKFTIYDGTESPALDGVEITEMAVDGPGRLWIIGQRNEVVVMKNGVFRRMGTADGLSEEVGQPRVDPKGNVWFKGSKAFHRFKEGTFEPVLFRSVNNSKVVDFQFGPNGTVWAVLDEGRTLAQIGLDYDPVVAADFTSGCFGRFIRMEDGSLALPSTRGMFKWVEDRWECFNRTEADQHQMLIAEHEVGCADPSGNNWIGTYNQGLFVWPPDGRVGHFPLGSDSVTWIRAMISEAQGNVWVGKRDGLFRLRPTVFRNWAEESGMERSYVHSMASGPDGTLWFANGWELSCLRRDSRRIQRVSLPASADKTWCVQATTDGSVWAGDLSGQMFRRVGGGMQLAGNLSNEVTAIHGGRDGVLWVGTTDGLWQFTENGFKKVRVTDAMPRLDVRSITEDSSGRLIVLALGIGIFRREGDDWRPMVGIPGAAPESLETLYMDREGTLWATLSTHGFARLHEGRWCVFEISTTTGPAALEGLIRDGDGHFWLASDNGLFRIHQSLMATNFALRTVLTEYRRFDRNDGLGSVACTAVAYVPGTEGNGCIWVGTQNGAAVTELRTLAERRERSEPPRTLIEAVQWDDRPSIPLLWTVKGPTAAEMVVPAFTVRVRISYTATRVQFPEKATFQYRLSGLADDWVQAGTERDATFLRLAPGRYQFQVRSANRHGDWSIAPAILKMRVLPAWWQTGWFRAATGLFVGGLLWLAYAQRVRRLKREGAMQAEFSRQLIRSQEQERKRIAGELHDSLGQNLLVAKNLALVGLNANDRSAEAAKQFGDISHAVSEALSEARRISKALRPPELDRMGLTRALRGMVQRASESSGINCHITMDDIDGLLPATEEINVYRLVQEVINNIVKHSRASRADIEVLHHPDHLALTIADNGQGFDVEKVRTADSAHAGMGLTGMEERTRLAGGDFEVTSQSGKGTVVRIRIPVSAPNA